MKHSYFTNDKTILHVVYQIAFASKYHFVTLEFLGLSMEVEWGIDLSSWPLCVKIIQENVSLGYVYLLTSILIVFTFAGISLMYYWRQYLTVRCFHFTRALEQRIFNPSFRSLSTSMDTVILKDYI